MHNDSYQMQRKQESPTMVKADKHNEVAKKPVDNAPILITSTTDEDSSYSQHEKIDMDALLLQFDEEHILLDDLPTVKVADLFKVGNSFRMYIAQIQSPYKFWFQLKEDEASIDSLMDNLAYGIGS